GGGHVGTLPSLGRDGDAGRQPVELGTTRSERRGRTGGRGGLRDGHGGAPLVGGRDWCLPRYPGDPCPARVRRPAAVPPQSPDQPRRLTGAAPAVVPARVAGRAPSARWLGPLPISSRGFDREARAMDRPRSGTGDPRRAITASNPGDPRFPEFPPEVPPWPPRPPTPATPPVPVVPVPGSSPADDWRARVYGDLLDRRTVVLDGELDATRATLIAAQLLALDTDRAEPITVVV